MRKNIKTLAATLMATVLAAGAGVPALAASAPAEGPTPAKEEVVYGVLAADGTVDGIYVVNSYNLEGAATFTDYGDYTEVRNMNTPATLTQNGSAVEVAAPAGELFYQGTAASRQLPWNIRVQYTLDGQAILAQALAGKSGALEISVAITQNGQVDEYFFENFALQATVTLDTLLCKNIVAQGATAANVGSNKQLTWTILPGNEKTFTITADVQDFEMEAMSFNGVSLNLDIDVEEEELLEQVTDLTSATQKLDDGAVELLDGAAGLQDGANTLRDGAQTLADGVAAMQSGADTLNSKSSELATGSATMLAALQQLQAQLDAISVTAEDITALVAASQSIQQGISDAAAGAAALQGSLGYDAYAATTNAGSVRAGNEQTAQTLQATIDALAAADPADPAIPALQAAIGMLGTNNALIDGTGAYFGGLAEGAAPLAAGLNGLNASYAQFHSAIAGVADTLATLPAQMATLKAAIDTLAAEYAKLDAGIAEYTAGVATLAAGFAELKTGANALLAGAGELAEGTNELAEGCEELADGTAEMREETSGLDADITEQIDEMINSIAGDEATEAVSFMSPLNTGIKSVQFALRTPAIEIPEAEAPEVAEPEPASVWSKFTSLFS